MNLDRIALYKKQLKHADVEWRNAGLLPDMQGGSSSMTSVMRYMDAYRGDFPDVMNGGVSPEDQMAGNISFSIVNTMVSTISGDTPDPILKPMGGRVADEQSRRAAWINEQVARTIAIEKKFKSEVDMATLGGILTPMSILRHGWTPEIEYEDDDGKLLPRFKNQTPDLPWLQYLRPWEYRIDPMVNDFRPDGQPRWVAFRNLHFDYQIRDNPALIFRKDLKPTHFTDIRPMEERKNGARNGPTDPNFMPMYEEWVVYDFERQTFFGISPGSDQLIREERDWPMPWGRLPYSYLGFNQQLDTPFPVPYMQLFYEEQLMYNRVWTIIKALVARTRRVIAYDKNKVGDEEANLTNPDSMVEFIGCDSLENAISEFSSGQIDGQLIGILFQLKEQIREVLGVSSFDRGQRANVETAAEANQIGAGSQNARSRNQAKLEELWEDIYRVSHRTFLQSGESRKMIIPIIGQENLQFLDQHERERGFLEIDPGELQGEFQYSVRLGSTIKQDPGQQLTVASSVYNILGGTKSELLDQRFWHEHLTELGGVDPRQSVVGEQLAGEMAKQGQGEGEEGGGVDPQVQAAGQQGLPDVARIGG